MTGGRRSGTRASNADRDRMFLLHQGLVRAIAWKTHRRLPQRVEIDDLIAYGEVGLLEAIDAFDATMGRKFTTYAWYRIRGSMLDGLGKMAWFNRAAMERGQYETPPAAPPTTPGSAAAAVAPPGQPVAAAAGDPAPRARPVRNRPFRSEQDTATIAAHGEEAGETAATRELVGFLRVLIDSLPEKEAGLLRGTFFEGRTLTEAARRVGISTAWASRLQTRTLADLRIALERAGFG